MGTRAAPALPEAGFGLPMMEGQEASVPPL